MMPESKIYSVSELNELVNAELSQTAVRVRGEVADFKRSQNGKFVYFDLKDESARMSCFVMAFALRVPLEDGMEVVATGSPGLYVPYGKYTFRVQRVEPVGEGALKRAFEFLRKKLEAEGLFAPERKKELPRFPERIGLITSREAAAYTDFLRILANRWGGITVFFRNVHVQGDDAEHEIVGALRAFNAEAPAVDVLVLTRGGGSLEDLKAFNNEAVARAVFASKIPVVAGVGHERDITLADLAADVRAATPSNAAELVAPSREEVRGELEMFENELTQCIEGILREARERADTAADALERSARTRAERWRTLAAQLEAAFAAFLARAQKELAHAAQMLETLNPRMILSRGYSITQKGGKVVKDVAILTAGDEVETILHRGKFASRVEEV